MQKCPCPFGLMAIGNEHCSWTNEILRATRPQKYLHVIPETAFLSQKLQRWRLYHTNLTHTESAFEESILHGNKNSMIIYLWNQKSKSQKTKLCYFRWDPITLSTLLPVGCNTHNSSDTLLLCVSYNLAMNSEFQFRLCYRCVKQSKTTWTNSILKKEFHASFFTVCHSTVKPLEWSWYVLSLHPKRYLYYFFYVTSKWKHF